MTRNYSAWQEILKTIPDNVFFEITRTYLGKLKTPFNKADLIRQLLKFFSRPEIREKVFSLINDEEKKLLSLIAFMESVDSGILWTIFQNQMNYRELRGILLNLEERFLIYSFIRNGKRVYSLSPLFSRELKSDYLSLEYVSSGGIREKEASPAPVLFDDFFLTGFYSRLFHNQLGWKNDNTLTSKSLQDLENLFNLKSLNLKMKEIELFNRFLLRSGLLSKNNNNNYIFPENRHWQRLSEWSQQQRAFFILKGILETELEKKNGITRFLINIANICGTSRQISFQLFEILALTSEITMPLKLKNILVSSGYLVEDDDFLMFNPWWKAKEEANSSLIVNQNFDILVPPGFSFSPFLSRICESRAFDMYGHLHLEKNNFLRGMEKYDSSKNPLEILEAMTKNALPQNIAFTLNEWINDFKSIQLDKGILLRVDKNKALIIDKTEILIPYLICHPADGIYLLSESSEALWREALENLDIGYLPQMKNEIKTGIAHELEADKLIFSYGAENISFKAQKNKDNENSVIENRKELETYLETQNQIPAEEKEILKNHIKRKLILSKEQICPGAVKPRLNTAKGLDFNGKLRLIENSLSEKNCLLELTLPGTGWDPLKKLIYPHKILKEKNVRTLEGTSLPEEENFNFPIEKIISVKLIKNSFF